MNLIYSKHHCGVWHPFGSQKNSDDLLVSDPRFVGRMLSIIKRIDLENMFGWVVQETFVSSAPLSDWFRCGMFFWYIFKMRWNIFALSICTKKSMETTLKMFLVSNIWKSFFFNKHSSSPQRYKYWLTFHKNSKILQFLCYLCCSGWQTYSHTYAY